MKTGRTASSRIVLGAKMLRSQQTQSMLGFAAGSLLKYRYLWFVTVRLSHWQIATPSAKITGPIMEWPRVHRIPWSSEGLSAWFLQSYRWFLGSLLQISVNELQHFQKDGTFMPFLPQNSCKASLLERHLKTFQTSPGTKRAAASFSDSSQSTQPSVGPKCICSACSALSLCKNSSSTFASCSQTGTLLACHCQSRWETWNTRVTTLGERTGKEKQKGSYQPAVDRRGRRVKMKEKVVIKR